MVMRGGDVVACDWLSHDRIAQFLAMQSCDQVTLVHGAEVDFFLGGPTLKAFNPTVGI